VYDIHSTSTVISVTVAAIRSSLSSRSSLRYSTAADNATPVSSKRATSIQMLYTIIQDGCCLAPASLFAAVAAAASIVSVV
jgi:hypothetical protein